MSLIVTVRDWNNVAIDTEWRIGQIKPFGIPKLPLVSLSMSDAELDYVYARIAGLKPPLEVNGTRRAVVTDDVTIWQIMSVLNPPEQPAINRTLTYTITSPFVNHLWACVQRCPAENITAILMASRTLRDLETEVQKIVMRPIPAEPVTVPGWERWKLYSWMGYPVYLQHDMSIHQAFQIIVQGDEP